MCTPFPLSNHSTWSGAPSLIALYVGLATTPTSQRRCCSAYCCPRPYHHFCGCDTYDRQPSGVNVPRPPWCLHWIATQLHGCCALHGVLGYLCYIYFQTPHQLHIHIPSPSGLKAAWRRSIFIFLVSGFVLQEGRGGKVAVRWVQASGSGKCPPSFE